MQTLFDAILPRGKAESANDQSLSALLEQHGFDRLQHEQVRSDLKEGRIGLAQNRLPASAVIENVRECDVMDASKLESQIADLKIPWPHRTQER